MSNQLQTLLTGLGLTETQITAILANQPVDAAQIFQTVEARFRPETETLTRQIRETEKAKIWREVEDKFLKNMGYSPEEKQALSGKKYEELLQNAQQRLQNARLDAERLQKELSDAQNEGQSLKQAIENQTAAQKEALDSRRIEFAIKTRLLKNGFGEKTEEAYQYFIYRASQEQWRIVFDDNEELALRMADGSFAIDTNRRVVLTFDEAIEKYVGFMKPAAQMVQTGPLANGQTMTLPKNKNNQPYAEGFEKARRHLEDMNRWVAAQQQSSH